MHGKEQKKDIQKHEDPKTEKKGGKQKKKQKKIKKKEKKRRSWKAYREGQKGGFCWPIWPSIAPPIGRFSHGDWIDEQKKREEKKRGKKVA